MWRGEPKTKNGDKNTYTNLATFYMIHLNSKEYFSNIFYQNICRVNRVVLFNLRSAWGQHAAPARSSPDPAPLSMRKGKAEAAFDRHVYILNLGLLGMFLDLKSFFSQ